MVSTEILTNLFVLAVYDYKISSLQLTEISGFLPCFEFI